MNAEAADFTCESRNQTELPNESNTPDPQLTSLYSLSEIPQRLGIFKKHSSFVQ